MAPGRDRHQGQVAFPVEAAAVRAGGDQGHLRAVVGQGAEVVQLEAQRIEAEVHRLARSQVLEVQAALGQLDAVDAQRNGSLGCSGSGDSLGGILNRLARLSWPFSSNSSSVCGPSSSTSARCSWRFHRLSSCRLAYSRRKASWGLLLAQAQTPEGQFQAEGVEFDTFETCGDGGVLRQLLVGDAQPDAGYEQKAQQAIDEEGDQQGADSAFQSFGHGSLSFSVLSGALEYGTASRFRP